MKVKEIQLTKSEVVTDVICDCCGQSCKVNEGKCDNPIRVDCGEPYYEFSFMKLEAHWGYYSGKDLESWTAELCEKCVDEKLPFIKFKKGNYL